MLAPTAPSWKFARNRGRNIMFRKILSGTVLLVFLSASVVRADDGNYAALKLACMAATAGMPNGSGATIYYPNGRVLTSAAGRAGATWYYENGKLLTNNLAKGGTFQYINGRVLSPSFGNPGAIWYYQDGRVITNSAPALTQEQIGQVACDLIMGPDKLLGMTGFFNALSTSKDPGN